MESVDEIFLRAREIADVTEREAYLAKACGTDAALRERVEALLRDAEAAEDFFGPQGPFSIGRADAAFTEDAGAIIGRYKLLQKIGEGGMGVVYMAEQREPVVRKVALKIIKLGMDTRQVVARFEAERQALALMDHPNIARVLDGGVTGTGRPYFVMDLVQGLPITQFCDEGNLSTRDRLHLFLQVCSAVQHAHQKGIIHRDIKPSNVLVTLHGDKPVPKVIDFGIAKATHGRLTEKTLFTQFQHFIGTPAYMSPEQASLSGLDVDTRSDIYSLGVLLYELLTGKTPFDPKELIEAGLEEMRRTIREKEPARPSTRLSTLEHNELTTTARQRQIDPPKLIHLLRGDLDWIVMKCLEKDRARRYATANGLAMDLQRHLGNEPVVARPPTAAYRIQKLIRRHRSTFATAAAVSGALVIGFIVAAREAVLATRAEHKANQEAEVARAVRSFITEQVLSASPWIEPVYDPARRPMLEQMARAIEGRFTNQPLTEADLRFAIGQAFDGIADVRRAAQQFEKSFEIRRRLLAPGHSDALATAANLASCYSQLGRRAEAEQLLADAVASGRRAGNGPSLGLAEAVFTRGEIHRDDRSIDALADLEEAIQLYKRAAGENDIRVTATMAYVAYTTALLGRTNEADRLLAEGLRRSERLHGTNNVVTSLFISFRALAYMWQGQPKKAMPVYERLLSIRRRALPPDHPLILQPEFFLAQACEKQGLMDEAARRYAELPRRMAPYLSAPRQLGMRELCRYIARFFVQQRNYDEARRDYELLLKAVSRNAAPYADEFGLLLEATAATKGWPAAADACRASFDKFTNSPGAWRAKAAVFAYLHEHDLYCRAAGNALALASSVTNWAARIPIIHAAAREPMAFSTSQLALCRTLIHSVEEAIPLLAGLEQRRAHRAVAALQMRLGQFTEGLAHAEKGQQGQEPDVYGACGLTIQSICLSHLGRSEQARTSLAEAETIMRRVLPDPLIGNEGFLSEDDRLYLSLRQEAVALLAGN